MLKNAESKIKLLTSCHVDNTQIAGHPSDITAFIKGLRKRFVVKQMGLMTKHLGIAYKWGQDEFGYKVTATLHNLVDEIIKMMERHVGYPVQIRKTPAP